jgi:hypothetical protein
VYGFSCTLKDDDAKRHAENLFTRMYNIEVQFTCFPFANDISSLRWQTTKYRWLFLLMAKLVGKKSKEINGGQKKINMILTYSHEDCYIR